MYLHPRLMKNMDLWWHFCKKRYWLFKDYVLIFKFYTNIILPEFRSLTDSHLTIPHYIRLLFFLFPLYFTPFSSHQICGLVNRVIITWLTLRSVRALRGFLFLPEWGMNKKIIQGHPCRIQMKLHQMCTIRKLLTKRQASCTTYQQSTIW